LGADGVLSVGPYYNKPTQNGFFEHFKAVAEAGCPVIVYNVPSRTGSNIEASTMLRLAQLPNIVATKEASGNSGPDDGNHSQPPTGLLRPLRR
jgi:4-hydroxy-tetrahydrodipicolinate synthase